MSELFNVVDEEDYCKICLDDFLPGKQLQYDIFVKLSPRKFVKIANEGDDLAAERIQAYKHKGVHYLYMRKDAFRKYVGLNVSISKAIGTNPKVTKARKLSLLKHSGEIVTQRIFVEGLDQNTFDDAKTVLDTTLAVVTDDNDITGLLEALNTHADALYAHSLGVGLYAAMVAHELRWNNPTNLFKVSMAGLLHDIGMKELDPALAEASPKDMSTEELKLYECHPKISWEILGQASMIPSDVLQAVLQHHENCLGLGFPSGLKKMHIHPMARVLAVVDEFCKLTIKSKGNPMPLKPHPAIRKMLMVQGDKLDPVPFAGLMRLFNFKVPAGFGESVLGGNSAA